MSAALVVLVMIYPAGCDKPRPQAARISARGGNICRASPSGETLAPLLVLEAEANLARLGEILAELRKRRAQGLVRHDDEMYRQRLEYEFSRALRYRHPVTIVTKGSLILHTLPKVCFPFPPGSRVTLADGARLEPVEPATILLHKPMGYVSGQAEDGHEPAVMLAEELTRLAPGLTRCGPLHRKKD